MNVKTIEIRDRMTFIPALAIRLGSEFEADRFLMARAGYGRTREEQSEYVILMRLGDPPRSAFDPVEWGDRTMQTAHRHIAEHFDQIDSGDVVDVEFVLGEKSAPSPSERHG